VNTAVGISLAKYLASEGHFRCIKYIYTMQMHCTITRGNYFNKPKPFPAALWVCRAIWYMRNYEFHNHFVNMRSTQDKLQPSKGLWSRRRRPAHFVGASLSCGELKIIWVVLVLCAGKYSPSQGPTLILNQLPFVVCHLPCWLAGVSPPLPRLWLNF